MGVPEGHALYARSQLLTVIRTGWAGLTELTNVAFLALALITWAFSVPRTYQVWAVGRSALGFVL